MEQIYSIAAFYEGGVTAKDLIDQPVSEIVLAAQNANRIARERKAEMSKK